MSDDHEDDSSKEPLRPDPPSSWEVFEQHQYRDYPEDHDADADDDPPFDVEHSLPTVEDLYTDRAMKKNRLSCGQSGKGKGERGVCSTRFCVIVTLCVIAMAAMVGFGTRISETKKARNDSSAVNVDDDDDDSSSTISSVADDKARRDTDLLNLLFKRYKEVGLDVSVLAQAGTPQFKAVQWIADLDKRQVGIDSSVVQRYALAVMYYALGGSDWVFHETTWMRNTHECEWNFALTADQRPESSDSSTWRVGVQCTGGDMQVDRLLLPNNNLKGELPQEVGLLTNMLHFSVFNNELSGALPESIGLWTSLKFLDLASNSFSGQLGDWFKFPKLEYLSLGDNSFSGELPSSFKSMTSLYEAALENNKFTGGVDNLNRCTNLKILYLQKNQLDGKLKNDTFADFTTLQDLDLSENKLQGALPLSFYKIQNVDLHMNQLSGSLPAVPYGGSHSLSFLSMYENKIKGSIPTSIGYLSSLTHLDLSKNRLSGSIPDELQKLTNLQYLFLQKNPFRMGSIPSLYGLTKLKELSLQETNRNSTLPSYIGEELTSLVLLDLHENDLTGSIPSEFGSLSSMRFLLLNKNQLTGNIPWQLMYMKKLAILMLDQNDFGGSDAAVCGDNKPATLASFVADCNELQCDCCTKCCDSDDASCNALELQTNGDNDFSRDHYVFGENLVFSRNQ